MRTRIITPQSTILLLALAVFLVWWSARPGEVSSADVGKENGAREEISAIPIAAIAISPQPMNDGVYLSNDKVRISVRYTQTPRLIIIQRVAEEAGFSFSLPDNAFEHWQEKVTVNIDNEPVQTALAKIIGAKNFNLEVGYDATTARHKISALFLNEPLNESLNGSNAVNTVASPVGRQELIPFEREVTEAPKPELTQGDEARAKRAKFFAADEKSRIALLNEMSPVGEDLHYIITSLRSDEKVSVRVAAAQRLSFGENYLAIQSLIDALSDKDEAVAKAAVNSLANLGDSSVLPVVENKLAGNDGLRFALEEAKNRMATNRIMAADQ
ncbi:MAG TPA: HEAT repeat domain-containing protein [Cellvibrio sp.]|nr:HEAT repeat domain-containing protein [Cellvibrio sp.]